MYKNKYIPWIAVAGFAVSLAVVLPAFAAMPAGPWNGQGSRLGIRGGMPPGVFGTVSSISGDMLMVTQKARPNATSTPTVTYTVDATNAKVIKNGTTSTVASIATGDMVMVQGTVSGTNVTATVIRDGVGGMMGNRGPTGNAFGRKPTSTPPASPIQGNGEPVIAGSVTAITGDTLTVTNASNVTYTIDATSATIVKNGATSTVASIATSDNVVIQGTVNGTSVTASSVIDQGNGGHGNTASGTPPAGSHPNIFGAIGNFFKHLFGF